MSNRIELNKPTPNFTLTDFNGHEFNLSGYEDKKNILLVFNRGFL